MLYSLVQKYRRKRKGEKDERARDGLAIELAVCSDKEALSGLLSTQQGRPGRGSIYLLLHTTRLYIGTYLSLSLSVAQCTTISFFPRVLPVKEVCCAEKVSHLPLGNHQLTNTHTHRILSYSLWVIYYIFFFKKGKKREELSRRYRAPVSDRWKAAVTKGFG